MGPGLTMAASNYGDTADGETRMSRTAATGNFFSSIVHLELLEVL